MRRPHLDINRLSVAERMELIEELLDSFRTGALSASAPRAARGGTERRPGLADQLPAARQELHADLPSTVSTGLVDCDDLLDSPGG